MYLSGLQALYSPRPPTQFTYTPLPDNPKRLQPTDVNSFRKGGTTIAAMDDAHVTAASPNGNFAKVFGATHYSYQAGAANVIVTDSSHIGILPSDPFQTVDTDESQYQWLADQLTANRSKVAIVATHTPAYDPHPRADSQFTDRWEAQMYEELLTRYQNTHPGTHVMLLFGHARGFAENLLDQYGNNVAGGLPNFVVADAGSPAYAPVDQGGFYNYGLFHVLPDGTVQCAAQPVLASITVTAPQRR